jgi:hypothetical protein
MVHQDPPHGFRRGREEVRPAVEFLVSNQAHVGLVD